MLYIWCVLFAFKYLCDWIIDEEDEHDYWYCNAIQITRN